ncbi:MAG: hypothetical protein E6J41_28025 [Chloroflexi bacterium]|nr:MAG: hypothetical protein E6J41_28025 [Chloroflexota bacterium]
MESGAGRRWTPFLVALGLSAALAIGAGVATSRLVAGAQEPPRLRTVPAQTLSRAGITVAAASQPPYCEIERGAAERGWTSSGVAGCAVSRMQAQSALLPVFQGHVTESVLARVSGPATSNIGSGRLVWMVVVSSSLLVLPTNACGPPVASGPACAAGRLGPVSTQAVVFVDATNGQVLTTVPVPASAVPSPSPMPGGRRGA